MGVLSYSEAATPRCNSVLDVHMMGLVPGDKEEGEDQHDFEGLKKWLPGTGISISNAPMTGT